MAWAVVVAFIWPAGRMAGGEQKAGAASVSDAKQVLARVLADWRTLRESVSAVRYSVSGRVLIPAGARDSDVHPEMLRELGGRVPKRDYMHDYRVRCLLDFERNRFRLEVQSQIFNASLAAFNPLHELWVFDGTELRRHSMAVTRHRGSIYSDRQPEFIYHELTYPVLTMEITPVLLAHGVVLCAANMKDIGQLRSDPDPRWFAVHGTGVFNGKNCVVVRASRPGDPFTTQYELWVDRSARSRVVRVRTNGFRESGSHPGDHGRCGAYGTRPRGGRCRFSFGTRPGDGCL